MGQEEKARKAKQASVADIEKPEALNPTQLYAFCPLDSSKGCKATIPIANAGAAPGVCPRCGRQMVVLNGKEIAQYA